MSKSFHFAVIASGIAYDAGAIPRRARLELNEIVRRGHRVTAFGMSNTNPRIELPCPYVEVKPIVPPRPFGTVVQWASFEWKLAKLLKTNNTADRIDATISYEQLYGIRQRQIQSHLRSRSIHQIQRTIWDTIASGANPFNFLHTQLLKSGAQFELSQADGIVALHQQMAVEVKAHCPKAPEPYISANGIAPELIEMSPFEKRNPKEIVFVGRLSPEKRFEDLLAAVAKVKDADIQIKAIGGSCDNGRAAKATVTDLKLANQVTFFDNIPHQEVQDHLRTASVLVLPSVSEGMPFVILEAMAKGLPIIASDIPGNRFLLNDKTGILFPPRNFHKLAQAIEELLNNRDRRRELSLKSIERATCFQWPNIVRGTVDYYELITSEKKPSSN